MNPALPSFESASAMHNWLRSGRNRLWRAARLLDRKRIVDLACGWGHCTSELVERTSATIFAVDADIQPMAKFDGFDSERVHQLQARAERLPLPDQSVDLVFAQCAFLWISDVAAAIDEIGRVLQHNGTIAAIEPDYGAMIEFPEDIRTAEIWRAAIRRTGGNPLIGRRLAVLLREAGFAVQVLLADRLEPADPARFEMLAELPLEPHEQAALEVSRKVAKRLSEHCVVHLPFFFVLAEKR